MMDQDLTMSFTAGGLSRHESIKLSALFVELSDWEAVRKKALAENLLQTRTISTSKRIFREVCPRLKMLSPKELQLLVNGSNQEQGYILWLAVCRRYEFISIFAREVIRERYLSLRTDLRYEDFDYFFHKESMLHPELGKIRPVTQKKLRQVLFRILREADLLTTGGRINPTILTPRFIRTVSEKNSSDLFLFPISNDSIKGAIQS